MKKDEQRWTREQTIVVISPGYTEPVGIREIN